VWRKRCINWGYWPKNQGDYPTARDLYTQSLEIKQRLGDQAGIATTLRQLGNVAYVQGDYIAARDLYTQSLDTARRLGDQVGIAQSLHNLGAIAQDQGDYATARDLYTQSLEIERRLGDQAGIASTLHQLGRLAEEDGNLKEAEQLFVESLATLEALHSPNAASRAGRWSGSGSGWKEQDRPPIPGPSPVAQKTLDRGRESIPSPAPRSPPAKRGELEGGKRLLLCPTILATTGAHPQLCKPAHESCAVK